MKKLVLRSLMAAVLLGPCIGFSSFVTSVHVSRRYDPALSEEEGRKLRDLPIAKAEEMLAARSKPYTRLQWLGDSIGHSYFWKPVAKNSLIPIIGIFLACIWVGGLQRLQEGDPQ